jgi:uncharacterized protein (TIGR03790 family)
VRPIAAFILFAAEAYASTADSVLVVVNRQSSSSVAIGSYYIQKRQIPAANLCRISTPSVEQISRAVYESDIAKPVRACLSSKPAIRYIVITAGVPIKISGTSGLDGELAAVDSELTLVKRKSYPLKGAVLNPFYGRRDVPFTGSFNIHLATRLAAYDEAGAKAIVDRCLAARNRGKFVLDLKSAEDVTGNDWLRNAALLLPAKRVVLDESTTVLYDQSDVIGYASWGSNDRNRNRRWLKYGWLPGAIATQFVSTDARTFRRPPEKWGFSTWSAGDRPKWWEGSPQSLAADFIAEGASGASGHVYEPYLHRSPRPDYLLPEYAKGRNLAESFYLAIPALSWQNIVVGDPLCSLGPPE